MNGKDLEMGGSAGKEKEGVPRDEHGVANIDAMEGVATFRDHLLQLRDEHGCFEKRKQFDVLRFGDQVGATNADDS